MIGEVALAMTAGLGAQALSSTIHPYPTQAEVLRKLGDAYRRSKVTPGLRRVLQRFFHGAARNAAAEPPLTGQRAPGRAGALVLLPADLADEDGALVGRRDELGVREKGNFTRSFEYTNLSRAVSPLARSTRRVAAAGAASRPAEPEVRRRGGKPCAAAWV